MSKIQDYVDAVKVELINTNADNVDYLRDYVFATWDSKGIVNEETIDEVKQNLFNGTHLPQALETVMFTFKISGISLVEVTHILRYRNFTFAAQCTGDRDLRNDKYIKPSCIKGTEFEDTYDKIINDANKLYGEMVDHFGNTFDARYILPVARQNYYYVTGSLKDWMHFINQRCDEIIQPVVDNLIAYNVFKHIADHLPAIKDNYDFYNEERNSRFYINQYHNKNCTRCFKLENDELNDKYGIDMNLVRRSELLSNSNYYKIKMELTK